MGYRDPLPPPIPGIQAALAAINPSEGHKFIQDTDLAAINTAGEEEIRFAWRYYENLASSLYKPVEVFKRFSMDQLLDPQGDCVCLHANRFAKFLDARTKEETSRFTKVQIHVRTTNVEIIQHPKLREL